MTIRHKSFTNSRIIALGFFLIIIIGAVLLTLPISSRTHTFTDFFDSIFTATSAVCVTGLVVFDTYSHWSLFGQLVILALIQIGGLGFMTVITMLSTFFGRKISLRERNLLMQSEGTMRLDGVLKIFNKILLGTLFFELTGAVILFFKAYMKMGVLRGIFYSVFHSVSAFCNAGFDIMGKTGEFQSLTSFSDDLITCLTFMALIVIGGLGFFVWNDVSKYKLHFKKYELHTKIVLVTTALLILIGWILFYIFEGNFSMESLSFKDKLIASLFQSVTTRTAGFNTIDQGKLSNSGAILSDILMIVGGSPGSTAGGIKTTTLAVIILNAIAASRNTRYVNVFKRRIDGDIIRNAFAVLTVYILAILASTMIISTVESIGTREIFFEAASAIGTVGLSTGITAELSDVSRLILMILMFSGRIGGLSLMMVFAEKRDPFEEKRPSEKIMIG